MDGLCLSCGVTGASSALMEEINRLLDVEVELHLLEEEQVTKPPIPPPPFDCAWRCDGSWTMHLTCVRAQ